MKQIILDFLNKNYSDLTYLIVLSFFIFLFLITFYFLIILINFLKKFFYSK